MFLGEKNLYIFTNGFPGGREESFLEEEITVIHKFFHKIIIIPYLKRDKNILREKMPNNVYVEEALINPKELFNNLIKIFKSLKKIRCAHVQYFYNFNGIKRMVGSLIAIESKIFKKTFDKKDIFYFYWGVNAVDIIHFLEIENKKVVRFHGYDLYENRSSNRGKISFRKYLLERIDLAVFISNHGFFYLKQKYPNISFSSIISKLGVTSPGLSPRGEKFTILTCSGLLKEKRVHLLIEALKNINHEIYWFHIGDGPLKVVLERRALDLPNNIKYKFLGFMKNKKVKEFYTNNSIDLFINVSESEGLPVSIMEAFSSGVPVIATDVGGTAELVDDEVGRLIPKDFKIEVLVRIIKQFVIGEIAIPREVVYNRWSKSVNANKNYTDFAQKLLEI